LGYLALKNHVTNVHTTSERASVLSHCLSNLIGMF